MVNEWSVGKLGELVTFKTGKLDSNASVPDGDYPFFTCSQETFRTNTFSFDTECVLLGGNNANGIFPLKYFNGKFDAYQRTYVIKPRDTNVLNTKFLYYALRPKLSELRSFSTGAATKFLTMTILNDTEIPLPPLPVQRKIAGILSAYDELIENSQQRIKILESMARALYREWFVNFRFPGHEKIKLVPSLLGDIPKGWDVVPLSSLVDFVKGRKPIETRSEPLVGDVKLLLIDSLHGGKPMFTSPAKLVLAEVRDTIMVMDGASSCEVTIGSSGAVGSTLGRVRAKQPELYSPHALYRFLEAKAEEFKSKNIGAAIPHANKNYILLQLVPVPTVPISKCFHDQQETLQSMIETLKSKMQNLRQTRDMLLPRLLSGTNISKL